MIKSESNSKIGLIQKNLPNIERLLENILLTLQQQNTSLNNIIDLLYKLSNLSIATAPHFDRLVDQLFKNIDDNIAKFTKQQLLQILSSGIKFKLNQNNKTILINVSKKLINIINDEAIDVNDHHKIDLLFSLATIDANYDLLNKIEFYDADLKSKLNNIIMALHKKLVNILQDSNKEFILSELGAPLLNKAYMALWYFQKALDDPQKKLFSLKELRPIKEFIKLNSTSQISISFFQDEVTKKIIESLSKSPKKILVENFIKTMPIDVVIMNPNKVKIPVQINGPVHFMFSSLVGSTSELPKTPKHVFHAKLLAKKNPSKLTRSRSRLWYLGKPKTSTKRGKSDIFTRLVKKLNYCLMLYRPFIDLLLKKP